MNDKRLTPPKQETPSLLRLVGPLLLVLIGVAVWRCLPADPNSTEPVSIQPRPGGPVVSIEVSGPEVPRQTAETVWREGLTVRDATEEAIPSVWRGKGKMAFLDELAGVASQGGGGLNWQFEVNGEYAQKGAGDFLLAPGDRVLWKLAPYE